MTLTPIDLGEPVTIVAEAEAGWAQVPLDKHDRWIVGPHVDS